MKRLLKILALIVVIVIVAILVLPFFVDANRFRPELESALSSSLGRKIRIGQLHLAILSGGISVDRISIADDPVFSSAPFLTAQKLTAGVALWPLIFSKRIEVRSFTITDPQVSLIRAASGAWNFSSLGQNQAPSPAPHRAKGPRASGQKYAAPLAAGFTLAPADSGATESAPEVTSISVQKFTISGGTVTVRNVGGKARTYQDVNLVASDVSYNSQFPFQLEAGTPGSGKIEVQGRAGPADPSDVSLSPFSAKVTVDHLDLAATGFVPPNSGLSGIVGFDADVASVHGVATSKGTLTARDLRLMPPPAGAASRVPVELDYRISYDLSHQTGLLREGDVHIGKAIAQISGTYNTQGAVTTVDMKLAGKAMDVPALEGLLPALGISLPPGASLTTGALDLNLSINGPVDRLVIAGPLDLSNARLSGFSLGGQLAALAAFAGLPRNFGKDTDIQTLSSDLRMDPTGTQAQNLKLIVGGLGALAGRGVVSSSGQLEAHLVAKIQSSNQTVNAVAGLLSSITSGKSGGGGIPLKITGTTSHPVFLPDVGAFVGGGRQKSGSPATPGGILGGLLRHRSH